MSRLTRDDWITAGFRALTAKGAGALRAEALARDLGTTKGSFYWHFSDVPTFHLAMMAYWEAEATVRYIAQLDQVVGAETKLRLLCSMALADDEIYGGVGTEPAIRAWAKSSDDVAAKVADVDRQRLGFLSELFGDMGLTNPSLAPVFYASLIGLQDLAGQQEIDLQAALEAQIDMIIALAHSE